eukprot:TRINITY_DN47739_c0_g1_i1.p1 TRINITY_DN47739_c0_g1~~TRINITY_DN47739_c0_g1_i1.p1  ORF type:complete len:231 (-),score=41.86 TRINITY_DN47739_c0_g1_i1:117-734(-)
MPPSRHRSKSSPVGILKAVSVSEIVNIEDATLKARRGDDEEDVVSVRLGRRCKTLPAFTAEEWQRFSESSSSSTAKRSKVRFSTTVTLASVDTEPLKDAVEPMGCMGLRRSFSRRLSSFMSRVRGRSRCDQKPPKPVRSRSGSKVRFATTVSVAEVQTVSASKMEAGAVQQRTRKSRSKPCSPGTRACRHVPVFEVQWEQFLKLK